MKLVTIITPTYNRANTLGRLYNSLINQTSMDFEWLIVDDGSIDDTKELVCSYQATSPFIIRYIGKKNGGKHTALNKGIKEIKTKLTFIVDSDDVLLPNAVEEIKHYYEKYKDNHFVGVYSFLRCKANGSLIASLPKDEFVDSYIDCRVKDDLRGDMAEVFCTEVLKEFPFPEFQNEHFLSEDVVWIPLGLKYKYAFINKAIYQCEYLEGGLTDSDKPMKFASPLGSMMRGKVLMNKECGIKANIRGAIIYNCYKLEIKIAIPKILKLKSMREKLLVFITYPFGIIFNSKWKK